MVWPVIYYCSVYSQVLVNLGLVYPYFNATKIYASQLLDIKYVKVIAYFYVSKNSTIFKIPNKDYKNVINGQKSLKYIVSANFT
jgi:hypothetical protein